MSAWSTANGKAQQLSYAERLRLAQKPSTNSALTANAGTAAASSSKTAGSSSTARGKTLTNLVDAKILTAPQTSPSRQSSKPASGEVASDVSKISSSHESKATDPVLDAAATPSPPSGKTPAPSINVWEARKKQLADKEAERDRERQPSSPSQPRKGGARAQQTGANQSTTESKARAVQSNNVAGSKARAESASKTPSASPAADKKVQKAAGDVVAAAKVTTSKSDKAADSLSSRRGSGAASVTSSLLEETSRPSAACLSGTTTSSLSSSVAPTSANTPAAVTSPAPQGIDDTNSVILGADVSRREDDSASTGAVLPQVGTRAEPRQSTVVGEGTSAQKEPVLTRDSHHTQPPSPTKQSVYTSPDDIPSSPATVASAIEEVLKSGGASGKGAEDDDAWLARIHLLNGGQNMPKFGGYGSNGSIGSGIGSPLGGLSSEEEAQAAQKAEKAVAAAWGAGKNVWQKNQQQRQQQQQQQQQQAQPVASSQSTQPSTRPLGSAAADLEIVSARSTTEALSLSSTNATATASAKPSPTDVSTQSTSNSSMDKAARSAETKTANKAHGSGASSEKIVSKKAGTKESGYKRDKQSQPQPQLPSFEDVHNWPSPLDAGKKAPEKTKAGVAAPAVTGDGFKPPTAPKDIYETLNELQLKLAPGTGAHPAAGASGGGKKGKQQWISIVPNITHSVPSSSTAGQKQGRGSDGKAGRGAGKQSRKDKDQSKGQQHQQGGNKKESGSGKQNPKSDDAVRGKPNTSTHGTASKGSEAGRAAGAEAAGAASSQSRQSDVATPSGSVDQQAYSTRQRGASNSAAFDGSGKASSAPMTGTHQGHMTREGSSSRPAVVGSSSTAFVPSPNATVSTLDAAIASQSGSTSQVDRGSDAAGKRSKGGKAGHAPHPGSIAAAGGALQSTPSGKGRDKPNGFTANVSVGAGTPPYRGSPRGSMSYPSHPNFGPRSGGVPGTGGDETPSQARQGPSSALAGMGPASPMPMLGVQPVGLPAQPLFYPNGPPIAGTPHWMPPVYGPGAIGGGAGGSFARPQLAPMVGYEATSQTGAPMPPGVQGQLLSQVEFYFSQRNLEGDFFLRQRMDAYGWVDIAVVAGFKRVQGITRDLDTVKDALLHSAVLDVDADNLKVRKRVGWELYVLPEAPLPATQSATSTKATGASPTEDDDQVLGVVSAHGFGGTLNQNHG
ncbi:hypothetical protein BCV70DRAFT_216387 [Testicularia cyperi]|uniref:HTH La-type RNA-binding domain-containing protein n=1 Tax=Testicularia cyperi TaxID=1882483 RepID=A0A317XT50_9BASI|nr:hypothetical protein BCV70DRAFT_216387 [Testicularia cyperi]